jgi:ribonucleoside-diphosphate reductase subunit M2
VKPLIDDEECADSPDTVEASNSQEDNLEEIRKKFVGEVDLPESTSVVWFCIMHAPNRFAGEEPLLKESKRRFVLFPIQYREVISSDHV